MDEFDPSRSASRALSPFHWRGASGRHSNIRWNAYVRHTGRILSIGAPAARAYSPDQPRVDMWRRIAGGLLEVHRCVRSLHSHTYNFEVTSLGCVRRGPALLYMGVVSLSTGGLVGRGGGRRREFTMSRSRAACVGRAPCHSRRVAQAPESLGVRAKSAERCDVDHCVSSVLDF